VKRMVVLVISCLFFFCLFRAMTAIMTLLCCLVMAGAYAVSRIDQRYLLASKYPLIGLCLLLSPALVIYPAFRSSQVVAGAALFLAFYGIAFFLVTTDEKGRSALKEVMGLSLLYWASSLNLFLTGHPEVMLPLSVATLLFLFIINRIAAMAFIAAYGSAGLIFLALRGSPVLGALVALQENERSVLLACAFCLLLITFAAFVRRPDFTTVLGFFGLLYVSVDLLMSVGFRLKALLLTQPALALLIIGPLMGMAMKGGKERR